MTLLSLLVFLIIVGLVYWAITMIASGFGIPAPIMTVIYVAFVVIVVLYLLRAFGMMSGLALRWPA